MIKQFSCAMLIGLLAVSSYALSNDDELITRNDSDGDGIVDTADIDDDNDGVPDIWEIAVDGGDIDTDSDGMPDRLDLDSDNDSLLDWQESGASRVGGFSNLVIVGGRLQGEVGRNGMLDIFELNSDSRELIYSLLNSDAPMDDVPDLKDLDSDNDGLSDMREAGVLASMDSDGDARIDSSTGSVGSDGIPDQLQTTNDHTCCDLNGDGADDATPRNSDLGDFADFQDLDSDNDGASDLLEAGGSDTDANGVVDNFADANGDGLDDGLAALPLAVIDNNGNGDAAEIDAAEMPTNTVEPDDEGTQDPVEGVQDDQSGDYVPGRNPVIRPNGVAGDEMPQNDAPGADDALVQTGLDASGCSIASRSYDFLLILLIIGSVSVLGWRFTVRRQR